MVTSLSEVKSKKRAETAQAAKKRVIDAIKLNVMRKIRMCD